MRQTLEAQQGGAGFGGPGTGMLDFTAGGGGGRAGSQAAERRRLLEALALCCQVCVGGLAGFEGGSRLCGRLLCLLRLCCP